MSDLVDSLKLDEGTLDALERAGIRTVDQVEDALKEGRTIPGIGEARTRKLRKEIEFYRRRARESTGPSERSFFWVGVLLLVATLAMSFWGFTAGNLQPDQRWILIALMSVAFGFASGAFVGRMTAETVGPAPRLAVSATGGFAVFLLTYFFLPVSQVPAPPPGNQSTDRIERSDPANPNTRKPKQVADAEDKVSRPISIFRAGEWIASETNNIEQLRSAEHRWSISRFSNLPVEEAERQIGLSIDYDGALAFKWTYDGSFFVGATWKYGSGPGIPLRNYRDGRLLVRIRPEDDYIARHRSPSDDASVIFPFRFEFVGSDPGHKVCCDFAEFRECRETQLGGWYEASVKISNRGARTLPDVQLVNLLLQKSIGSPTDGTLFINEITILPPE